MSLGLVHSPTRTREERGLSRAIRRFVRSAPMSQEARRRLLRFAGVRLDGCVSGLERVWVESPSVEIGAETYLNAGVWLEGGGPIRIGTHTMIGPETMLVTSAHARLPDGRVEPVSTYHATTVGDHCWLGARVVVLPGVHVADGCVIAAGAVVTKNTEPGGTYAGVPARRIK